MSTDEDQDEDEEIIMLRIEGIKTTLGWAGALAGVLMVVGCDGSTVNGADNGGMNAEATELQGTIGAEGGELVGASGTALAGVHLVIPPGALGAPTAITIRPAGDSTPLPATAVRCGPMFAIEPAGLTLATPAALTLPFDETVVNDQNRFDDEVKVWVKNGDAWGQRLQTDDSPGLVTIDLDALQTVAAGVNPPASTDVVTFHFAPNPKFTRCFAQYPDDPSRAPSVDATVVRGELNDGMFLKGKYIKPGLAFDLFTVQNDSLGADGAPVAGFGGFGLAWYQSDLQARSNGSMKMELRTILLDQIFGFDPAVSLAPTGTFEVGFWFNDPNDAAACGFDVSAPTPFNGEHKAGPLAMITLPDATTGLGPLCTKPDTSVSPARCSP
jgi:ZU5 domain